MFPAPISSPPAFTVVGDEITAFAAISSIPFFRKRKETPFDMRSATFRLRRMTCP